MCLNIQLQSDVLTPKNMAKHLKWTLAVHQLGLTLSTQEILKYHEVTFVQTGN